MEWFGVVVVIALALIVAADIAACALSSRISQNEDELGPAFRH